MIIDFVPQREARERSFLGKLLMALGLGALAIVVGGLLWALLAYFLERLSLAIAFGIGAAIALAFAFPFAPVTTRKAAILFVPCVASTLSSILLGAYMLTVLLVIREFQSPLIDSARLVASNFEVVLQETNTAVGLFLGSIGAIFGYLCVIRQR